MRKSIAAAAWLWEALLKTPFMQLLIMSSNSQEQCGFLNEWIMFLILSMEGMRRHEENSGGIKLKMRTLGHSTSLLLYTGVSAADRWKDWEGSALKDRSLNLWGNNSRSVHANILLMGHGACGAWQYYHKGQHYVFKVLLNWATLTCLKWFPCPSSHTI